MGLYLYCIGAPDHPLPDDDVTGVDDAPVRHRDLAGFRLWLSRLDAPPAPSWDRVRRHNAVAEAASATMTPLPLRFGQWFDTDDELERRIEEKRDTLERGLRRVADTQEFGVRLVDPAAPTAAAEPPDRSTGRAYLQALARRERKSADRAARGREIAERLRDWLGDRVRDQRVRSPGSPETLAAVAHLVARHDTGNYRRGVREFERTVPELSLVLTGPWPPYGFVDDG